jgi:hypothetical protein
LRNHHPSLPTMTPINNTSIQESTWCFSKKRMWNLSGPSTPGRPITQRSRNRLRLLKSRSNGNRPALMKRGLTADVPLVASHRTQPLSREIKEKSRQPLNLWFKGPLSRSIFWKMRKNQLRWKTYKSKLKEILLLSLMLLMKQQRSNRMTTMIWKSLNGTSVKLKFRA